MKYAFCLAIASISANARLMGGATETYPVPATADAAEPMPATEEAYVASVVAPEEQMEQMPEYPVETPCPTTAAPEEYPTPAPSMVEDIEIDAAAPCTPAEDVDYDSMAETPAVDGGYDLADAAEETEYTSSASATSMAVASMLLPILAYLL